MSNMTIAKNIGHGIGGFTLSLATVVFMAVSLQLIVSSIWTPPQSFLIVYGTAMTISILAISLSWICLLKGLRNRAMIRGVWCHIYAFTGIAAVSLIVALFL
jgi:hypothetical protein